MAQAQTIALFDQGQTVQGRDRPAYPGVAPEDMVVLDHLRFSALKCRSAARTDMFKACAVLAVEKPKARDAHAQVLVRTLEQALGTRPRFYRPGVAALTFDERWLVSLIRAVRASDDDSFLFLLRRRVPAHVERSVAFLIRMISE